MITIRFNNDVISIPKQQSLADLLIEKNNADVCCAVSVNREFIPKADWAQYFLTEHDCVEIITPMQGG